MAFSLIPDRVYSSIFEIDGTELSRRGVSLLLADLDNTLAKYGQPDPEPAVQQWKCGLAEAGVELFLLSNSRKPARAGHYARCLEVPYLGHAGKPRTEGFSGPWSRWAARLPKPPWWGIKFLRIYWGPNALAYWP